MVEVLVLPRLLPEGSAVGHLGTRFEGRGSMRCHEMELQKTERGVEGVMRVSGGSVTVLGLGSRGPQCGGGLECPLHLSTVGH